jgi:hypothetical protein
VGRVIRTAGLTLVAVVVAVTGAFIHAAMARPAGVPMPYGLVLALLGLAAVLWLAHSGSDSRLSLIVVAAGWLLPVVALTQSRPAGDLVIPGDARGLTFLFGGVVLVGLALGIPVRARPDDDGGDSGSLR